MTETDPLAGKLVLALTIAARVTEVVAHRRAEFLREARQQSEAAGRRVEQQQRAEAALTRHQLRVVGEPGWWDRVTPVEVASAYTSARSYAALDPELAGTAAYMAGEIERRFGVEPEGLVRDVERKVQAERAEAIALMGEARTADLMFGGADDAARLIAGELQARPVSEAPAVPLSARQAVALAPHQSVRRSSGTERGRD